MTTLPDKKAELELINGYTSSALTQEQVFTFTLTLCDNEVDRDMECFTPQALLQLKELFKGKTGIFDHSMSSRDQRARIFYTYIEEGKEKTSYGEPYLALKARAYMLTGEENDSLINEIRGGIKKEVSISCSAADRRCSICGEDKARGECRHKAGKTYGGRLCYTLLSDITDAYEWSFVAVPAQRRAGVSKAFKVKETGKLEKATGIINEIIGSELLPDSQAQELLAYVGELEQKAAAAQVFHKELIEQTQRLALLAMPAVSAKSLGECFAKMDIAELQQLRKGLEATVQQSLPVKPQLTRAEEKLRKESNNPFKI